MTIQRKSHLAQAACRAVPLRGASQLDVMIGGLDIRSPARHIPAKMKKSDVTCPNCRAGYRRIELASRPGAKGEYRCLLCDHLLEIFDGSTEVALRLTVQPERTFE
jgi:hypothetical protein